MPTERDQALVLGLRGPGRMRLVHRPMILATDLQAIIAGAKRPKRAPSVTARVTVYKTWNDKGATMAALRVALGGGRMVSLEEIIAANPRLKWRTVAKTLQKLAREGKVRRMVVLGRIFWMMPR